MFSCLKKTNCHTFLVFYLFKKSKVEKYILPVKILKCNNLLIPGNPGYLSFALLFSHSRVFVLFNFLFVSYYLLGFTCFIFFPSIILILFLFFNIVFFCFGCLGIFLIKAASFITLNVNERGSVNERIFKNNCVAFS